MAHDKSHETAWQEACHEADRLDPGWRWEDLLARRPILPAEQDAIQVAAAAIEKMPPEFAKALVRFKDEDIAMLSVEELQDAPASVIEVRDLAVRLAYLSAGRPPDGPRPALVHLPCDSYFQKLALAKLLRAQCALSAKEGRSDDAILYARAILGVARAVAEPPTLMAALIVNNNLIAASAAMIQALDSGQASPVVLVDAQKDLEELYESSILLEALRGERALQEELERECDGGNVTHEQIDRLESQCVTPITGIHFVDALFHRIFVGKVTKLRSVTTLRYWTAVIELFKNESDANRQTSRASGY